MDTPKRTVFKALTWQGLGFLVMSVIGFLMTGSWATGGQYALISCATGFVTFLLHERAWACITWGVEIGRPAAAPGRFRMASARRAR
ncbi:MAG: DUF2061 domain-containing protein [Pseudomonadota bacterium]